MAARKKLTKPEPVAVTTICSVCGFSWLDHGKDPTTDDCIRLLKEYAVPIRPWYWEDWYHKPYRCNPYATT